ncbi:MAG: 3-oxo-5-alpha-steroid 4-dehydrogenase [Myxococcota bacterium]
MSPLDPAVHSATVTLLFVLAVPVFVVLWWLPAPYGRHGRQGWGPTIPGRIGWMVMEAPTIVVFGAVLALSPHGGEPVPLALAGLWWLHYVYRTVVYPLRLPSVRPMPLPVVGSGLAFQLLNASANAAALGTADYGGWATDPRFGLGVVVFLAGQAVHHHGDHVLMRLRARGDTGYSVPTGGLYTHVTNVAYLGELVTWLGWALATSTPAGLAMFVFTAANLVPRARSNHAWYRETFADYPAGRRVLLPWIW